jgi:hypothetical protein
MNKFLLVTLIYLGTTSAFASDCSINYVADDQLTNIIKKNGFQFENYQKLCQTLNKNNAGIKFSSISQISPYQTTSSVRASFYLKPTKYKGITSLAKNRIGYEEKRTTNAEIENTYNVTMELLADLANDDDYRNKMLKELNEMKDATK